MKYKVEKTLVVPRGYVTAKMDKAVTVFQQGQAILPGWIITDVDPPELEQEMKLTVAPKMATPKTRVSGRSKAGDPE